ASMTLSPATLSGAATTRTITVETDGSDPDVAPADVTLTVTAAAGELSDSAELTLRVGLLKVRGKVTGTLGTPADTSGVVVSVNGGAAIPVEADGTFEGPEVAVPYDLVVAQPPTLAHVYRGLTTTDLTLELSSVGGSPGPPSWPVSSRTPWRRIRSPSSACGARSPCTAPATRSTQARTPTRSIRRGWGPRRSPPRCTPSSSRATACPWWVSRTWPTRPSS